MEENKDYQVYRFDYLTEGSQLKLDHSVYCEDVDISSLITQSADVLEALRQDSMDGEQKALAIVQAAAKQWEQQAAVTQKLNRALAYLRTPEVVHTGNEWRKTGNWRDAEEISNRVYKMTCSVWEDTKYDRETQQSVPVAWYVTWDVYVNSPKEGYGEKIAGQNQKRYTDKAAAMKYLDGRKKAYNKVGCLFADYENKADFSDRNTIIYGHNMRDGSMFAVLNEYDEQSYFDTHKQMYLVTPEGGYLCEIFAAFVAKPSESGSDTSPWRLSWKDDGAYTTWLTAMAERSVVETDVTVTSSDKVLTLSTCTPGGASRFIVMAKLVEVNN